MPEIPKLDAGLIIEKQIFLVLLVMCYAGHRGIVRFGDLRWKSIGEEERDKVYIYLRLHEDRGAYAPPASLAPLTQKALSIWATFLICFYLGFPGNVKSYSMVQANHQQAFLCTFVWPVAVQCL